MQVTHFAVPKIRKNITTHSCVLIVHVHRYTNHCMLHCSVHSDLYSTVFLCMCVHISYHSTLLKIMGSFHTTDKLYVQIIISVTK